MAGKRKQFRIWCAYDTETSNELSRDGIYRAWPILYIFNDLHECDMNTYVLGDAHEQITFERTYERAIAYIERMIEDAAHAGCIPIMCTYNMMFDMQTLMYELHKRYDMQVNAQSSTNVYTLDLMRDDAIVLRVWDTYHLEMRGLSAMGETCGVPKLMGDWDYDLVRTPETHLTDDELGYAARDVQVIPAYLRYLCDAHDWLTSDMLGVRVLTKTSIVRQMARAKIGNLSVKPRKGPRLKLIKAFEELCRREQPADYDSYALRLASFRGGLTFTSALTASCVVERVFSLDETSAHHAFINGRRVPVGFHPIEPATLKIWLDDVSTYTLDDVLGRYAYPFQRWFHVQVRIHGLKLRGGSAFEAWGIGLLAQAKFNRRVGLLDFGDNNMRAIAGLEDTRERGYVDKVGEGTFAFGKLMRADDCVVHLSELEWWCVCQVYEFDSYEVVIGEGTVRSIWPPDYVTLQSNMLFEQKNDAKVVNAAYKDKEPYDGLIGASIPDGIAAGLRKGDYTKQFVEAWYGNAVKGQFNSIYGTQAQNVMKPDYMVKDDAELAIDNATKTKPDNYDERLDEVRHPMVLYTYGLRIVGGSRMQLIIAMMLLWQAFGGAVIVTGGDTDSLKVATMPGVEADDLIGALEPLHRATTEAIDLCMHRLRQNFPDRASTLDHVGCFELEPAIKGGCPYYAYHLEAWNKARISLDADMRPHITCAGLSQPDDAYNIGDWYMGMVSRGHAPQDVIAQMLSYNTTITHDVCHALEHERPKFSELWPHDVTDYQGMRASFWAYSAIALYPSNRRIGDTMKNVNADNVRYLREAYHREVDTTETVITVDYNYPYAMALMGRTWPLYICKHFVENFSTPRLYRQQMFGMEEVSA